MPCLRSTAVLFLLGSIAPAADWPQWLGPNRNASSPEKVLPWKGAAKTDKPGLKVLWRQPVGEGHSSPVVAAGRIFLHTKAKDQAEEQVTAFDARTGKLRWEKTYPRGAFSSIFGNGPRATPSVVDGHVYTFGVTGLLSCFKADNGDKVWQVDTLTKFKAPNLRFGASCSPLVDGSRVLVNVGGKGASVVAFNTDKGDVLWKSGDDPASYSSPILVGHGKARQAVFVTQRHVLALNPKNGSLFWTFPMVDLLNESSTTPVHVGDLLIAGSVTFGSVALRLEDKDDKPTATEAWKNPALTCYFSTPVAVGKDYLYMVTGTIVPPPQATLRCVEVRTGKEQRSKPAVGRYHAALLRTGDGKLLMLEDEGNLVLIDPDPKAYRELARSRVCGETWAFPALSDGRLYVRDDKELICLQLPE